MAQRRTEGRREVVRKARLIDTASLLSLKEGQKSATPSMEEVRTALGLVKA